MKIFKWNIVSDDELNAKFDKGFSDGWLTLEGEVCCKLKRMKKVINKVEDNNIQCDLFKIVGEQWNLK